MKAKLILATVAFLSVATFSANAQSPTGSQHQRITQGVKSGELTKAEAKKLRHDQRKIRKEKKVAKADGVITPAERKDIRKDKRHANRDIFRKKHNKRDRK
ncbi:hypothetical protein ACQ33O_04135 [Ferruginibacter sp. SUN002]|uniref:hypothetical protein n=1 Tax=Ferruginibacter sp. SUN002 TaxID=2937789 RepID=UPI003D36814D